MVFETNGTKVSSLGFISFECVGHPARMVLVDSVIQYIKFIIMHQKTGTLPPCHSKSIKPLTPWLENLHVVFQPTNPSNLSPVTAQSQPRATVPTRSHPRMRLFQHLPPRPAPRGLRGPKPSGRGNSNPGNGSSRRMASADVGFSRRGGPRRVECATADRG